MAQDISKWFKEVIRDKVIIGMQAHGGLLDYTMESGDVQGNLVKFPITRGRAAVYELSGSIQPVPIGNPGLDTIPIILRDYEAVAWWRTQDAYRAGPSEQNTLTKLLVKAIRRKRDTIKLDALEAFETATTTPEIATIGTGVEVPDVLHFEQARAEIASLGQEEEDEVFAIIPEMWMSQLSFYKEYGTMDWSGMEHMPFSKVTRSKMRIVHGIHYIVGPDEYFKSPAGQPTQLIGWMWSKSAMAAETAWNQETPSLSQHHDKEGSPWLAKSALSGAAVGLQPQGVKRFLLKKILVPVRPV